MKIKTLTPTQLWESYDPSEKGIELSILNTSRKESVIEMNIAFSARLGSDKTRARARVLYPTNGKVFPVILAVDDGYLPEEKLIESGFAIVYCDFSGHNGTIYGESVKFAEYGNEGEHITAKLGADNSAVFVRAKLMRRLITAVESLPMLDSKAIAVTAWGINASIAWQTAGMDKRVKALMPMLNFGWMDVRELDNSLTDDEIIRWNIGCSIQAYAKFVECKILILLSTNNKNFKFDKLNDTIHALNAKAQYSLYVSPQTDEQLYECDETVIKFLKAALVSDKVLISAPQINYSIAENQLNIGIDVDNSLSEIKEVLLFYTYGGEDGAEYRSWRFVQVGCDITGRGRTDISIFDNTKNVYCFARANYKNGVTLCSEPMCIDSDAIKDVTVKATKKRIIYERKIGVSQFIEVRPNSRYVTPSIRLEMGAFDILGIATDNPIIKSYRIGEISNEDNDSILQMDVFSAQASEFTVGLITGDGVEYSQTISLDNNTDWQKLQFNVSDFKDTDLHSMKNWSDVKCMKIYNADKILFNNILWV